MSSAPVFEGKGQLALGTVQLGMPYGIANRVGQPCTEGAVAILDAAVRSGIRIFDTAQAYGSSEAVIGHYFTKHPHADVRICTKVAPGVPLADRAMLNTAIEGSFARLQCAQIWAVLLHQEGQMDSWSGALRNLMDDYQAAGRVEHFGVSVYSMAYCSRALRERAIDVIQVPANVFDRRLMRARLGQQAVDAGKRLIVRSIFLQGLVLMPLESVPRSIPFAEQAMLSFRDFCRSHRIAPAAFAYGYVRLRLPQAHIVIGAESAAQVEGNAQLALASAIDPAIADEWDAIWPDDIPELINPAIWPRKFSS